MTNTEKIIKLINEELDEANEKFPPFHSPHEAYGVIKEELEETKEELECCEKALEKYWMNVKLDIKQYADITKMEVYAINVAKEAIQVAAMCRKTLDSLYW